MARNAQDAFEVVDAIFDYAGDVTDLARDLAESIMAGDVTDVAEWREAFLAHMAEGVDQLITGAEAIVADES
jgi:hypothetical protein